MNQFLLISIVAYGLQILDLLWLFIRAKKVGFRNKSELSTGFIVKHVLIYLFAIAIVTLCIFIRYSLISQIALCGCAVLAFEICSKDFLAS